MQKSSASEQTWSATVTPEKPLFSLPFREIWDYRDLILLSVHRDLVAIHRQTIMGPLWYFIQPLISTLVYQVIFREHRGRPDRQGSRPSCSSCRAS